MKKLLFVALMALGVVSVAQAAGNASAGAGKVAVCSACHGMDGNSVAPNWPRLAGQHADYIAKQLADFKSGARKDDTMIGMVAILSEQDMADIGAYFAGQKGGVGSADAEKAALGKKIYTGGIKDKGVSACMACHGPSGAGNPSAKFPSLSGQHSVYTTKALQDFRSGARSNDPAKMMQDIAAKMSDAEIAAVSEYIMGLH